jgi:hypothetical protein
MPLAGKPSEWVGRRFRNIHTGHVSEVLDAQFMWVKFLSDTEYEHWWHYRKFAKHFEEASTGA